MNMDMPSISNSTYSSATHLLGQNFINTTGGAGGWAAGSGGGGSADFNGLPPSTIRRVQEQLSSISNPIILTFEETKTMAKRRLVQVFIADTNDNIPLDMALLYRGSEHLTDATDQELFFEVDINSLLKAHNEKRVKILDKSVKERTEYLEPAKIRELKMVVVTIAEF